ncbi:MAG: hypothetical protein ABI868_20145 [Acidobacteriota bacterium]
MPDPLTGNGLTSGIRHARHAVDAILGAGAADDIDLDRRRVYSQHVFRLGHAFNAHIENAIYRPQLRWGLGFPAATYIYTFFAFFMNALQARIDPGGTAGMAAFGVLFAAARGWIGGWTLVARAALWLRDPAAPGGRASGGPVAAARAQRLGRQHEADAGACWRNRNVPDPAEIGIPIV